jgi:hypothetical protein
MVACWAQFVEFVFMFCKNATNLAAAFVLWLKTVLFFDRHFRKTSFAAIRDKNRVISKSFCSLWGIDYLPIANSFKLSFIAFIIREITALNLAFLFA